MRASRRAGGAPVQRLGFLDGYEVCVSAAPIAPAFALFAGAESRKSG
ncbi:hypothetical protein ABZT34_31565 [Streptomyces sp. NPDC005329]